MSASGQSISAKSRMAELLRVESLSAGYGEARVIHGVCFVLEDGRSLALLGRNGVGKTTLEMGRSWSLPTPLRPRQRPAILEDEADTHGVALGLAVTR